MIAPEDQATSETRICEICGRAAQQMGSEARCAEHDSERKHGTYPWPDEEFDYD